MDEGIQTRPLIIGITGNIGSGKTSFCRFLQELGEQVCFADTLAKEVLHEPETVAALIQRWGTEVAAEGIPQPEIIAERVFGKPEELKFLNSLVHPGTLKKMQQVVDNSSKDALFFEVPLLFEAQLRDCFDFVVLIIAPHELLIERLMEREGLDEEDIIKRIKSQMPDSEKLEQADLVIWNNSTLKELRQQAYMLIGNQADLPRQAIRDFFPR